MSHATELRKEMRELSLKFALEEIEKAEEALDQAHAAMKDLDIHNYIESPAGVITKGFTVVQLAKAVEGLRKNLEKFDLRELDELYDEGRAS